MLTSELAFVAVVLTGSKVEIVVVVDSVASEVKIEGEFVNAWSVEVGRVVKVVLGGSVFGITVVFLTIRPSPLIEFQRSDHSADEVPISNRVTILE